VFGSNAGWFSENNFVAEADRIYTIIYTSFSNDISIQELQQRLHTRVLQNLYQTGNTLVEDHITELVMSL
jgi:diphthamide biosynthesis methyltransferase